MNQLLQLIFITVIAVSCQNTSKDLDLPESSTHKIKFNIEHINSSGLRGASNSLVAVSYEFAIPNTDVHKKEVSRIDPSIQFIPGSRGRIGATTEQCLCIGNTHTKNWYEKLEKLANLEYINFIIECHFE